MTADTVSGEEIRIMVLGIDTTLGDLSSPWLKLMPKGQKEDGGLGQESKN